MPHPAPRQIDATRKGKVVPSLPLVEVRSPNPVERQHRLCIACTPSGGGGTQPAHSANCYSRHRFLNAQSRGFASSSDFAASIMASMDCRSASAWEIEAKRLSGLEIEDDEPTGHRVNARLLYCRNPSYLPLIVSPT